MPFLSGVERAKKVHEPEQQNISYLVQHLRMRRMPGNMENKRGIHQAQLETDRSETVTVTETFLENFRTVVAGWTTEDIEEARGILRHLIREGRSAELEESIAALANDVRNRSKK